ncbi:MAG: TRAP transporter small permease [Alicyclobacillus macrosporangiidus]|uniref:TRAP transporter small permease n=1 Tax=Alicyclobacillus macrosporangiidus TaxID=392015 RepID=UPI0026F006D4|nr:TRAP transporter small permease [Alicyclobacillus macrosporangiidus]MCL6597543.1 TRAP transporter small permease [Alicyclobacillus macrosporangiidus]
MWLRRIGQVEESLASVLFVLGMLVNLYAVVMRYVFNMPPPWALEIFESVMTWAVFLGFGMALRDNHHIVVDLLYDRLPYAVKRWISVIANLIGAAYSVFMTVTGVQITALAHQQGIVTVDVGIPIWIPYLIMPVGMAFLGLYFIVKAYRALRGDRLEILGHISHDQQLAANGDGNGGLPVL